LEKGEYKMFTIKSSFFPIFICILVFSILLVFFIPGVFAFWGYGSPIPGEPASFAASLMEFGYKAEEVLPGGGSVSAPVGENHLALIEKILNEPSYGLNATKKPIIHNTLSYPGAVIYCDQKVQGGNLKHLMIDRTSNAEKLYFVVSEVSDTEYNIFTLVANDLKGSIGSEIEVYKTVVVKGTDNKWKATVSYHGYAKIVSPGKVSRAIDVSTWRGA
jgi:hypothetical protein